MKGKDTANDYNNIQRDQYGWCVVNTINNSGSNYQFDCVPIFTFICISLLDIVFQVLVGLMTER